MSADVLTPRVRVVREHHLVKELALTGPLTVGRLPDNDIVIDDDLVSGHHGRIEKVGGTWRYVDLGSTNGSAVAAGPTLRDGESFAIVEDCQVLLGATVLDIRLEADSTFILKREQPAAERPEATGEEAGELPPTRPRLVVVQGGRCKSVEIAAARVTLGRAGRCEVHIEDPSVSSRHAELRWDGSQWLLRDLASSNGTRVGLHRVTRARPVESDQHIILGAVELLFVEDRAPEPDPEPLLAQLESSGRLSPERARQARQERAAGKGRLGEILVRNGWLSPGQWVELAGGLEAGARPSRLRRLVLGLLLLAAIAALAALLVAQAQR
ncbi:MAG TPA: FHA domain-containing protein [Planctomycetota bacterium]|nr:FHA domain-containing protein [Planctomycetota bacterium]